MIETPEDKYLREEIECYTLPLKKRIQQLELKLNHEMGKAAELHHSELIADLLKKTSLFTRFKVLLEMLYLNIIIEPNTCCSDEEFHRADEWSKDTTRHLLQILQRWEKDGRPEEKEMPTSMVEGED